MKALKLPQNDDDRTSEYSPLPLAGAIQLRPLGQVVVSPFHFKRQSREFVCMRIRTVKPEFFLHEGLFDLEQSCHLPVRLSFAGLWCAADRAGRFKWEPRKLKAQILPYDEIDFSRVLDALTTRGFVVRYASGTAELGYIPSFPRHQVINNRERDSELPPPPEGISTQPLDACLTRASRVDDACLTLLSPAQAEGKGREGKGTVPQRGGGLEISSEQAPTEIQKRLFAIFNRRASTKWSDKELKALKALGEVSDEDLTLVELYYKASIPPAKDYRRRDLCTLLNNFQGEVDRARGFNGTNGHVKEDLTLEQKIAREAVRDAQRKFGKQQEAA